MQTGNQAVPRSVEAVLEAMYCKFAAMNTWGGGIAPVIMWDIDC